MQATKYTHLEALLTTYQPTDTTEHAYKNQMLELLYQKSDSFSRAHFTPGHFTASSFILSPDKTQLLLIFHSKLRRWLQPGGHIDMQDANILAAAAREVHEEVGITHLEGIAKHDSIFDIDIHTIPARKSEPEHLHLDIRFAFRAPNLEFEAGSDAVLAKWVALDEVAQIESDESVMRAVSKLQDRPS